MNKLIFITLLSLSLVYAGQKYTYAGCQEANSCNCHPSCICDPASSICNSCRVTGSTVDEFKRSCPCPVGYYTKSMDPFTCEQLLVPNSQGGTTTDDACSTECLNKLQNIILNTNCYFCSIDGKSYVVSEVSLNFNAVSLNSECKKKFVHKIQYLNSATNAYADLAAQYFTLGDNGSLTIKIPLIDVFNLTTSTTVGTDQIAQQISLMSILGVQDKVGKQIKWAICIYTNRNEVQVFQLDIDIQQTSQDCTDCIIIADLDTVGQIYTDSTFATLKASPYTYLVGDYFYAKITFADATYTKFLKFVSLYYKNDLGQIYDYSSITVHGWSGNGLTIALPLSEPSHPAIIQVSMLIDPVSGGRFLQENSESTSSTTSSAQKTNFSFLVDSDSQNSSDTANQEDSKSNGLIVLFSLMNLALMLIM